MGRNGHEGSRTMLAGCSLCQIERCAGCDVVHVHVGHASLRLTTSAFLALCATLLEAARNVQEQPDLCRLPMPARTGLQ